MILSKREKYIAVGASSAVALLILNSFVVGPYFQAVDDIDTQTATAQVTQKSNADTLKLARDVADPRMAQMKRQGLITNEAQTESNLQHSLLTWAAAAGVQTQELQGDPARKEGDFSVIGYRVTVIGSTASVAKLLWSIETAANVPVRITEFQVNPQPEGSDHLQAHLMVTTLCIPDNTPAPAQQIDNPMDFGGDFQ